MAALRGGASYPGEAVPVGYANPFRFREATAFEVKPEKFDRTVTWSGIAYEPLTPASNCLRRLVPLLALRLNVGGKFSCRLSNLCGRLALPAGSSLSALWYHPQVAAPPAVSGVYSMQVFPAELSWCADASQVGIGDSVACSIPVPAFASQLLGLWFPGAMLGGCRYARLQSAAGVPVWATRDEQPTVLGGVDALGPVSPQGNALNDWGMLKVWSNGALGFPFGGNGSTEPFVGGVLSFG